MNAAPQPSSQEIPSGSKSPAVWSHTVHETYSPSLVQHYNEHGEPIGEVEIQPGTTVVKNVYALPQDDSCFGLYLYALFCLIGLLFLIKKIYIIAIACEIYVHSG